MTARDNDPFHDDNLTQEEFEAAMNMNFPLITIPDPVAVGNFLNNDFGSDYHNPSFGLCGWSCLHWDGVTHHHAQGATPYELLANLRAKLTEHDPLAKLHKDAAALGFGLVANNQAQPPQ